MMNSMNIVSTDKGSAFFVDFDALMRVEKRKEKLKEVERKQQSAGMALFIPMVKKKTLKKTTTHKENLNHTFTKDDFEKVTNTKAPINMKGRTPNRKLKKGVTPCKNVDKMNLSLNTHIIDEPPSTHVFPSKKLANTTTASNEEELPKLPKWVLNKGFSIDSTVHKPFSEPRNETAYGGNSVESFMSKRRHSVNLLQSIEKFPSVDPTTIDDDDDDLLCSPAVDFINNADVENTRRSNRDANNNIKESLTVKNSTVNIAENDVSQSQDDCVTEDYNSVSFEETSGSSQYKSSVESEESHEREDSSFRYHAQSVLSQYTDTSENSIINWQKGGVIDHGGFGTVYRGLTNQACLIAVKEVCVGGKENFGKNFLKLQNEIQLLKALTHKNIIEFLGTSTDQNNVYIFMEYVAGGSIAALVASFGPLKECVFRCYAKQVVHAVDYLHKKNVVHLDIKGANVLVTANGVVKIIDFGCAKKLKSNQGDVMSVKGTPYWMSPEVITRAKCTLKSDIWSVGCTVVEMADGKPPWSSYSPYDAMEAIQSQDPPSLTTWHSYDARAFVQSCLTKDCNKRPSASELLVHPFLVE